MRASTPCEHCGESALSLTGLACAGCKRLLADGLRGPDLRPRPQITGFFCCDQLAHLHSGGFCPSCGRRVLDYSWTDSAGPGIQQAVDRCEDCKEARRWAILGPRED